MRRFCIRLPASEAARGVASPESEEDDLSERDGTKPEAQRDEEFVPRGAIAFIALMVLAYGVIWFFFYFLMVGRP
jgi:hypothetical protein